MPFVLILELSNYDGELLEEIGSTIENDLYTELQGFKKVDRAILREHVQNVNRVLGNIVTDNITATNNLVKTCAILIAVLPFISRLFEKLVANQLHQHVVDNGLLSPAESAYRHLHFTVTRLLNNTNDWYSGLDTGKLVGPAFDVVDHGILCRKLEHCRIQQR